MNQNELVTIIKLHQMKKSGEKISVLTSYDASFTQRIENSGCEVILVGDSLGMVVQGKESTVPVTMTEMIYHTSMVRRASNNCLVIADLPFLSYATENLALKNAGKLMKQCGAHMVKLEGGAVRLNIVKILSDNSIPVCAHLGLLPQSIHKLGAYKVQGRDNSQAESILNDALALQQAGADLLVLECVPTSLASKITSRLDIPVIGIGAGVECDGQVLVLYDMLGITTGKRPRFSKDFLLESNGSIQTAINNYVVAVRESRFPADEHSYK
ncbi:3-methyl-2-oxobutanoate hydroxymethyltransferase [hydrothermal vent metagenome]|uniref:3-methyl-2-oxobutanoate hydroxymethyltransferase n=1 Tax=hydrothermal vent metagenome TaxID=652676 RepID=A0A3B0ZME3_9ZZZZ